MIQIRTTLLPAAALALALLLAIAPACPAASKTAPKVVPRAVTQAPPHTTPRTASMWEPVIRRLVQGGLDAVWVAKVFARSEMSYDAEPMGRKLRELHRSLKGGVTVRKIQEGLFALGLSAETPDGKYGPAVRAAIESFQQSHGLPVNGLPNQDVVDALEAALVRAGKASPHPTVWTHGRVHAGVLTPTRLMEAREFHLAHFGTLQAMEQAYGVPGEMATAILTVETRHGRILGRDRAVVILASMALDGDPDRAALFFAKTKLTPTELHWLRETARIRGDWAFEELAALLRWCRAAGKDPFSFPSSPYGAVGWPQFMPSNIEKFGADGDGDGKVDLFVPEDAIHSIGRYFKGWGWQGKMDLGRRQQVVWRYNRSETYVNTVLGVAEHVARELRPEAIPPRSGRPAVVNNAPALQAALGAEQGANRRIELLPGNYVTAGRPLVLRGLQHVTLVGRGEVVLPGLHLERCQDVFLENITLRPARGATAAVTISGSSQITLQHVRMRGASTAGMLADGSATIRLVQCLVEGVQGPAVSAARSSGVLLARSVIRGVQGPAVLQGRSVDRLQVEACLLRENAASWLVDVDAVSREVSLVGCQLVDNAIPALQPGAGGVRAADNTVSGTPVAGMK
ncbi:putative Peptidoglycan-binding domain 1 protein [Megalodesulfovibrio gigas DSM 1382 = ATCC 19364]|uniref:Putative Peptidoglycan-binding domain 1 protein n=2 Tax=Megalodesulfovibrio gigas TaxID=879 RepID=T2GF59_MEGG1|nr:putative Peptidoglycan-binding domain 1 protein [Megalodesulfovibrio gigas DSM 1382 = ATCC 19364]